MADLVPFEGKKKRGLELPRLRPKKPEPYHGVLELFSPFIRLLIDSAAAYGSGTPMLRSAKKKHIIEFPDFFSPYGGPAKLADLVQHTEAALSKSLSADDPLRQEYANNEYHGLGRITSALHHGSRHVGGTLGRAMRIPDDTVTNGTAGRINALLKEKFTTDELRIGSEVNTKLAEMESFYKELAPLMEAVNSLFFLQQQHRELQQSKRYTEQNNEYWLVRETILTECKEGQIRIVYGRENHDDHVRQLHRPLQSTDPIMKLDYLEWSYNQIPKPMMRAFLEQWGQEWSKTLGQEWALKEGEDIDLTPEFLRFLYEKLMNMLIFEDVQLILEPSKKPGKAVLVIRAAEKYVYEHPSPEAVRRTSQEEGDRERDEVKKLAEITTLIERFNLSLDNNLVLQKLIEGEGPLSDALADVVRCMNEILKPQAVVHMSPSEALMQMYKSAIEQSSFIFENRQSDFLDKLGVELNIIFSANASPEVRLEHYHRLIGLVEKNGIFREFFEEANPSLFYFIQDMCALKNQEHHDLIGYIDSAPSLGQTYLSLLSTNGFSLNFKQNEFLKEIAKNLETVFSAGSTPEGRIEAIDALAELNQHSPEYKDFEKAYPKFHNIVNELIEIKKGFYKSDLVVSSTEEQELTPHLLDLALRQKDEWTEQQIAEGKKPKGTNAVLGSVLSGAMETLNTQLYQRVEAAFEQLPAFAMVYIPNRKDQVEPQQDPEPKFLKIPNVKVTQPYRNPETGKEEPRKVSPAAMLWALRYANERAVGNRREHAIGKFAGASENAGMAVVMMQNMVVDEIQKLNAEHKNDPLTPEQIQLYLTSFGWEVDEYALRQAMQEEARAIKVVTQGSAIYDQHSPDRTSALRIVQCAELGDLKLSPESWRLQSASEAALLLFQTGRMWPDMLDTVDTSFLPGSTDEVERDAAKQRLNLLQNYSLSHALKELAKQLQEATRGTEDLRGNILPEKRAEQRDAVLNLLSQPDVAWVLTSAYEVLYARAEHTQYSPFYDAVIGILGTVELGRRFFWERYQKGKQALVPFQGQGDQPSENSEIASIQSVVPENLQYLFLKQIGKEGEEQLVPRKIEFEDLMPSKVKEHNQEQEVASNDNNLVGKVINEAMRRLPPWLWSWGAMGMMGL